MNSPIAVVLAAGKGTRMKSDRPKVLCEACGRPLIEYVLDTLREAGVEKIICVVGYQAERVQAALSHYENIEFALQAEQLGTGHAVMMCRESLANHDGPVCVVAGDSPMLQPVSIRSLLDDFRQHDPSCLLGTLLHENPTGLGRIVRDENGQFVGIVEEKDANDEQKQIREVNMSTYVFDTRELLSALDELTDNNSQGEYYVTDVPSIMLKQGQDVRALPILKPIEALSVNTIEQLAQVEDALRDQSGAVETPGE